MKFLMGAAVVAMVGLSSPGTAAVLLTDPGSDADTTTITYSDPVLPAGTEITDQYADLGVTFGGTGKIFTGDGGYTSVVGGDYADSFSAPNQNGVASVYDFTFLGPVSMAGAIFEFNVGTTATFQTLLGGTVVESFVYANTDCCSSPEFIGFSNSSFDTLRLSNVTGLHFYTDNLRFSNVSAVPEPSTWAMMMVGFGGIGYSMRKRRKSAVGFAAA